MSRGNKGLNLQKIIDRDKFCMFALHLRHIKHGGSSQRGKLVECNLSVSSRDVKTSEEQYLDVLTECQASISDGECVHILCANRNPGPGGMRDLPKTCPLPWHRYDRALADEQ